MAESIRNQSFGSKIDSANCDFLSQRETKEVFMISSRAILTVMIIVATVVFAAGLLGCVGFAEGADGHEVQTDEIQSESRQAPTAPPSEEISPPDQEVPETETGEEVEDEIEGLKEVVNDLEGEQEKLAESLEEFGSSLDSFQREMSNMQTTLDQRLQQVESELKSLQENKMDELEDLQSKVEAIDQEVGQLSDELALRPPVDPLELKAKLHDLEVDLDKMSQQLTQQDIDGSQLAGLQADLKMVETRIEEMDKKIEAAEESAQMENAFDRLNKHVDQLSQKVNGLSDQLSQYEMSVEDLRELITDAEDYFLGMERDFLDMEERITELEEEQTGMPGYRKIRLPEEFYEVKLTADGLIRKRILDTQSVRDFRMEVTASELGGAKCSYGVIFRIQDESNYYAFAVNPAGYYRFDKFLNGNWNVIIGWTATELLKEGGANKLVVQATGSQIELSVNDRLFQTFEDDTFQEGPLGFFGWMTEKEDLTVRFRDVQLYEYRAG